MSVKLQAVLGSENRFASITAAVPAQVIAVAIPLGAGTAIGLGIQDEVKGWYRVSSQFITLTPLHWSLQLQIPCQCKMPCIRSQYQARAWYAAACVLFGKFAEKLEASLVTKNMGLVNSML